MHLLCNGGLIHAGSSTTSWTKLNYYCAFFMHVRTYLKFWDERILVWQSVFMKFLQCSAPSIVSDVSNPKFQNYSELQISWLKKYVSGTLVQILKEPFLLQKPTIPHMKALILSFLEPEGQGRGIVMKAPHLLPVKKNNFSEK